MVDFTALLLEEERIVIVPGAMPDAAAAPRPIAAVLAANLACLVDEEDLCEDELLELPPSVEADCLGFLDFEELEDETDFCK